MHGRLWGVVPAVLLLALAFAGCMQQGPHFENAGATEVSARKNAELAASAAKAWDPAAKLVGIGGGESIDAPDDALPADPDVGNGLAVQWTYVYQTAEGKSRAFEVSADGTVISKNESEAMGDYGAYAGGYAAAYQSYRAQSSGKAEPLANWTWDSDAALGSAMKNETFRAAARAPNATLAEALGNAGVPDAWVFVASSGKTTVIAAVNATSGELAAVHDLSRYSWQDAAASTSSTTAVKPAAAKAPPANATPVHAHESGDLTPSEPDHAMKFRLDGAEPGIIKLSLKPSGDVLDYGVQVTGPGYKRTYSGGFDGGQPQDISYRLPMAAAGSYVVTVTMDPAQGVVPLAKLSYAIDADFVPG